MDGFDIQFTMPDGRHVDAAMFGPQFSKQFEAIADYLSSPEYFADVADTGMGGRIPGVFGVLEEAMGAKFKAEGAAHGADRWAELPPTYAAWKQKIYGHSRIGERTGSLMDALTNRGAAGAVRVTDGRQIIFGESVEYGGYFNAKRPIFAFLDNYTRNEIIRQFHAVAVKAARGGVGDK
jgi:hypothetical protein